MEEHGTIEVFAEQLHDPAHVLDRRLRSDDLPRLLGVIRPISFPDRVKSLDLLAMQQPLIVAKTQHRVV
ncbi:hypothetical protein FIBSPDRAFT_865904 [Athelia psychrophila]|uniref:Uncharacterized protein n=1 Tax=Athelia psychrophila TaxID=1759441 RepID=A0A166F3M6_9AGAM|nr:hypothetical protein FIBSPDRAFT_865904 [Fibularhizoctonia sp. CBS 109695]